MILDNRDEVESHISYTIFDLARTRNFFAKRFTLCFYETWEAFFCLGAVLPRQTRGGKGL